jgi:putative transcriptional regulator
MTEARLVNTIRIHRARLRWTQAELAERAGVTRKSVNAIENGHFVPSTVLALKLASLLGVTVEELFQLPPEDVSDRGAASPSR